MKPKLWRKIWNWHFWLGVTLLLPLVWWMGTALVFALWPIEQVRGRTLSTGSKPVATVLNGTMAPPPEVVEGAHRVNLLASDGHAWAVAHRGEETQVWDLATKTRLGPVIPLEWALATARRDVQGTFAPKEIILYGTDGHGRRVDAQEPNLRPLPTEYAGPLPAYAFHFASGPALHLYVDALNGDVRARRSGIWRFYDWCFRLHSLEFVSDGSKRGLMFTICGLWFGLGGTGLFMAGRKWKRSSPATKSELRKDL